MIDRNDKARANAGDDDVLSSEEKLERALEDSMDASDPPSPVRPDDKGDPVPSSGFDPED